MPYSLLHFLIEWKILNKYCDYVIKDDINGSFIRAVENKEFKDPYSYFSHAFVWDHTSEGNNFWYRRAKWFVASLFNL